MIPELSITLRRLKYLSLVIAGLVLVGCKADPEYPGILVDVPVTFNVRLIEQLDTTDRIFSLEISTIEFQDCLDKTIDYTLSQNYGAVLLSLNDIITPDECQEGIAPAKSTVLLPGLTNRSYTVEIDLKNTVENSGILTVTNDRYILEMNSENGFQVLNPELLRIPENTVWGAFAYRDESALTLADEFMADMESICSVSTFETGDYGHFYVVSDQHVLIPDESPDYLSFRRNFLYRCSDVQDELASLLEDYRNTYGDDIHIRLYDDKGNSY